MAYPGAAFNGHRAAEQAVLQAVTENLAVYRLDQPGANRRIKSSIRKKMPEPSKDSMRWCCRACRADLGLMSENYKLACRRHDAPIQSANPNIGDWRRYIDDEPVFRQFFCPGCGRLIENEIARRSDGLLQDIELSTTPPLQTQSITERCSP
jgi:hypothetical protein